MSKEQKGNANIAVFVDTDLIDQDKFKAIIFNSMKAHMEVNGAGIHAEGILPEGAMTEYRINSKRISDKRGSLSILGEIGFWGVTASEVQRNLSDLGDVDDIDVSLSSVGGHIGEGLAIFNMLKNHKANVHINIEGYALSMGSQIAMAGDTVHMADNALFMIHNPHGGAFGDSDTLRKEADVLDTHKSALIATYLGREGLKLDRDALWQAMQDETWYTAEEAREKGFVDEVIDGGDEVNVLLSGLPENCFMNSPDWARGCRAAAVERVERRKIEEEEMKVRATNNAAASAGADDNGGDAPVNTPAPVAPAAPTQPNESEVATNAANAERARITGISAMFADRLPGNASNASLVDKYINDGLSVAEVTTIVDALVTNGQNASPVAGSVQSGADSRDKAVEGMANALLAMTGRGEHDRENHFNGLTLMEMSAIGLRSAGVTAGFSKYERANAAFTHSSSDFPAVIQDIAYRTLMAGYTEAPESFERWTKKGSMRDFRAAERVGTTEMQNLELKPEGAEYKGLSLSDFKETGRLATYGATIGFTREMFINDDLGAFLDILAKMGRAARRTVATKVFDVFSANPAMGDGTAWFHADHGNLNTTATVISTDSVEAIMTAMALNKGRNKDNPDVQPMGIMPNTMLVPAALRSRANVVRTAEHKVHAGATDSNRDPNTVNGTFEVIPDARLDSVSQAHWYMMDSANPAIEVAYLDGVDSPFLDQTEAWNVDGTNFKARIDAGVFPIEFASIYKQQ